MFRDCYVETKERKVISVDTNSISTHTVHKMEFKTLLKC